MTSISRVLSQGMLDDLLQGLDEATRAVEAASVDISRSMADLRRLAEELRTDPSRLIWSDPIPQREY